MTEKIQRLLKCVCLCDANMSTFALIGTSLLLAQDFEQVIKPESRDWTGSETRKRSPGNEEYRVASRTASRLGDKEFWKLWKNSFRDVLVDKGFTHAAAIAYYAIVSMFPLLLLLIVIIGSLLKEDAADRIVGLAWPYLPAGSLQLVRDNVTAVLQSRESISRA